MFLQKKESLSVEEFSHHKSHIHGPIAAKIPGLRSYIQYDVNSETEGENGMRLII